MPPLPSPRAATVYLVGAGPGEADLLTVRAARLIAAADVAVYDNLVGPDVLALIPATTQRIYVGKKAGNHALPQEEINRLLVNLAREGKTVIRLKGGDPYIFGRGGEEILELVEAGVPFEVVPGVTAAAGAAAYAGIPLTHREIARTCTFATGHFQDGTCDLDWPALARPGQTLVIYMGISALPTIARELCAHGLPTNTPAAVVRHATLADQRCIAADIAELPAAVAAAGIKPPALLIIGEVVRLRERLNWFKPD
ncbi:uroporphyrinogen-III C-methyltransferase [Niveibacterium sp. SC-1]|uniref:uroporphyrinogen-III C-methyltransferase n=1 Tax=Niveibacterium sp. SC-1 TaxID=3135646 RepID=UPI00311E8412